MTKLKKIWKSRKKILEGIWYNHIVFFFNKKHWALRQVKARRDTCKECPFYDKYGTGDRAVIRGFPACDICGCNIKELTACLSCECSYEEEPKWGPILIKDDYKIEGFVVSKDREDGEVY